MGLPKEQSAVDKVVDPTPKRDGLTSPHVGTERPSPRLPHERDESSDSQLSGPREVMKQAGQDLENGLVDTDRGPVLDQLYEEQVRTEDTPARGEPGPKPQQR